MASSRIVATATAGAAGAAGAAVVTLRTTRHNADVRATVPTAIPI